MKEWRRNDYREWIGRGPVRRSDVDSIVGVQGIERQKETRTDYRELRVRMVKDSGRPRLYRVQGFQLLNEVRKDRVERVVGE